MSEFRYERKYRIEGLTVALVNQLVAQHPAGFRTLYPDRQVNNIYFDTPDFHAFKANVEGVPSRRKWRLRWYGKDLQFLDKSVFEIKIKEGELGRKMSFPQVSSQWTNLPQLFKNLPQKDLPLQPTLCNIYQRSYLSTADQKFRITIDSKLRFAAYRPQKPQFHPSPEAAIILELKYEADDSAAAKRILDYIPFRNTKNSKYVSGIEMIYV